MINPIRIGLYIPHHKDFCHSRWFSPLRGTIWNQRFLQPYGGTNPQLRFQEIRWTSQRSFRYCQWASRDHLDSKIVHGSESQRIPKYFFWYSGVQGGPWTVGPFSGEISWMDSFPKNMRILILSKLMGGESREVYWELRRSHCWEKTCW